MGQPDRRTDQARRQKIKWGCALVKKWKMGGVYFVKKWTFPQRRVHYVQYQFLFYFTFYLFGGASASNAPPAYGPADGHRTVT